MNKHLDRKTQTIDHRLRMMVYGFLRLAGCCLLAVLALGACKPSTPSDVLSKGKMEDILYDYHVAEAMGDIDGQQNDKGINLAYKTAILQKYGVTTAEFDSSMVYYMRHTEQMRDIYKRLVERLNDESLALGGDARGDGFSSFTANGDTANVWKGDAALVLSTYKPFNSYSFTIEPDTSYRKGDKLMLDFNSQFIYQDGMRDAVAVLAVVFQNDSVASMNARISNSYHSSISVEDRDSLGIKHIRGYFLLNSGDFANNMSSASTLKLLFIENIRLIRLHPEKPLPKPAQAGGTADPRRRDSLRRDSQQSVRIKPDSLPKPPKPVKL